MNNVSVSFKFLNHIHFPPFIFCFIYFSFCFLSHFHTNFTSSKFEISALTTPHTIHFAFCFSKFHLICCHRRKHRQLNITQPPSTPLHLFTQKQNNAYHPCWIVKIQFIHSAVYVPLTLLTHPHSSLLFCSFIHLIFCFYSHLFLRFYCLFLLNFITPHSNCYCLFFICSFLCVLCFIVLFVLRRSIFQKKKKN